MRIDNTELQQITKVLGELKINDIGKHVNFCNRQRVIKPFELMMSLGDKSVDIVTDLHRYFVKLTDTDVHYKPFHNQLSKPEFVDFIKSLLSVAMKEWQQQVQATKNRTICF